MRDGEIEEEPEQNEREGIDVDDDAL